MYRDVERVASQACTHSSPLRFNFPGIAVVTACGFQRYFSTVPQTLGDECCNHLTICTLVVTRCEYYADR